MFTLICIFTHQPRSSLLTSGYPISNTKLKLNIFVCVRKLSGSGLLGNTELNVGAAIACFLAQEGADINYANHKGKSPLDLVTDSIVLQLIRSFSEKYRYVCVCSLLK